MLQGASSAAFIQCSQAQISMTSIRLLRENGEFVNLPLHAAGRFGTKVEQPISDRVISFPEQCGRLCCKKR
jgi:hypothetical protein